MDIDLSIIILSYNTKEITKDCLESLLLSLEKGKKIRAEIIIIDNASKDGSVEMIKKVVKEKSASFTKIIPRYNKKNVGYAKGNNQGIRLARGQYILLLNSDVIVNNVNFGVLLDKLRSNKGIGVLTVQVLLEDGKIDPASHRGFPTLWNSFTYFAKLEFLFGRIPWFNRIFGGYHLTHLNRATEHEIDSPTGAFYLVQGKLLKEVGGFDDRLFFMYGEDLDLSYRIKKKGYKIVYSPIFSVTHLKSRSGLNRTDAKIQKETRVHFYEAMWIFYKKHYAENHSMAFNRMVYLFIALKKRLA